MRRRQTVFAVALTLLFTTPVFAIHLVRDINTVTTYTGTPASSWTGVGGYTLFLMDDGVHGQELWRTAGTPDTTQLVLDINPGPATSGISNMTVLGGILYFIADDGTNGRELWRSDGTAAGTHIVADINKGSGDGVETGSATAPIPSLNGVLYFLGATTSTQLWRSDGTAAGTYQVSNISGGPGVEAGGPIVVAGTRIFFEGYSDLWSSDGTPAGTHPVANSGPAYPTATPAGLFFVAYGTQGKELRVAALDGSAAHLVSGFSPVVSGDTNFGNLVPFGNDVIFGCSSLSITNGLSALCRANTTSVQVLAKGISPDKVTLANGLQPFGGRLIFTLPVAPYSPVWVTDGTPAGTLQLGASRGVVSTSIIDGLDNLFSLVGTDGIYFFGYTGAPGSPVELWRTDGTEAGTLPYASLPQPTENGSLVQFQGQIFLAAGRFSASGKELWATDGTTAGTRQIADLNPGSADSNPDNFGVVGGRLFFTAALPNGPAPWTSDGTAAGTVVLSDTGGVVKTASSIPSVLTPFGNVVLFVATDGVHGTLPWVTDGTTAGTQLLSTAVTGKYAPVTFVPLGSTALFADDDATHGNELWATDGTPGGTHMVMDINPGSTSSNPMSFATDVAVLNGVAYFTADDGVHGPELWRSDGTSAGTYMVADITPGSQGDDIHDLHVLNGKVIFQCNHSLWTTDGTAAGTRQVSSAVMVDSTVTSLVANSYLYFEGQAPATTFTAGQLWRTDGTTAGTQQVTSLIPGASYTAVAKIYAAPGPVLFQFCATGAPCGLYATDGSAAGASLISPDSPNVSIVLGNRMIYAVDSTTFTALRVTDGTVAGTQEIFSDQSANPAGIGGFSLIQGVALFTRSHAIWRTDGTVAGTVLVGQVSASTDNNNVPFNYTAVGNSILFTGWSPDTGIELYGMSNVGPNTLPDSATVTSGAPQQIPVLNNDGTMTGTLAPSSVTITVQPAKGTVSVDPASGTVTFTPNSGASGSDQFSYTVADTQGHVSEPATVYVSMTEPAGPSPGTAPTPPSNGSGGSPPTGGGTTSSGSNSGGGGGTQSALDVLLLSLIAGLRLTRQRGRKACNERFAAAAAAPPHT